MLVELSSEQEAVNGGGYKWLRSTYFARKTSTMVVVRRRSSLVLRTPSYKISRPTSPAERLTWSSEVKMGDGRHSPTGWMAHYPPSPQSARSPAKPAEFSYDNIPISRHSYAKIGPPWATTNWWAKLLALCLVTFCVYSGKQLLSTKTAVTNMEREMIDMQKSFKKTESSREKAQSEVSNFEKRREELQELHEHLTHEAKVIEAMRDEGVDMHAPDGGDKTLGSWMNDRRAGLRHHWKVLCNFLQEQSKQVLIERFGLGPHRVEIVVQTQLTEDQPPFQKSFVVEMASMFDMPHSVYQFLDSVDQKLWDDTIFLHQRDVEHVLAVVPIEYESQNIKHQALQDLELQTLAFHEYSPSHPHEKYTLGFAGLGPTFYINTANNTREHGPGGQEHHRLPDDADPCFARVVEGTEVVDELARYGALSQNRLNRMGDNPWNGQQNAYTRIVHMRLLSPSAPI